MPDELQSNQDLDLLVDPSLVRYIKLGESGRWETRCLERGIIHIGFGSEQRHRFELCQSGRWSDVEESFISEGKSKGTAKRSTNELRLFFDDDGSTLWITFIGERLCWGMATSAGPEIESDDDGVSRAIQGGWRWTDVHGEALTKDRLSGALTQLASYRGTSCSVDKADYVIRRINGQKTPEVERALVDLKQIEASVLGLMRLLTWRDFETLVDLVFTTSGWRRVGRLGGVQKTLDLDLTLPSTGERAFVQVKAHTTRAELATYVAKIDELGPYDRMFYVFHSHSGAAVTTDDDRVTVITPDKLAEMVLDAGLANWLIRKVS